MATLTIRLPDDKHNRLKALARRKKMSINKLIEEISTQTLAEFDSETRFRTLAARYCSDGHLTPLFLRESMLAWLLRILQKA